MEKEMEEIIIKQDREINRINKELKEIYRYIESATEEKISKEEILKYMDKLEKRVEELKWK